MSSGCMNSVGCVDARVPVRASYVNLYKWPESDLEFVRSMAHGGDGRVVGGGGCRFSAAGPAVVDSFSCRQMYLRSYPFTRKETVPERTRRCIDKVKERTALFNRHGGGDNSSTTSQKSYKDNKKIKDHTNSKSNSNKIKKNKEEKKKKRKNGAKRLKDVSCSALYSIFRRLLSCTSSVDVVDGHHQSR